MTRLLIYQDYIHNNGHLHRALRAYGAIDYCDARDIAAGILDDDVHLLVMPGGADLYYCEKLNGAGDAAIRRYVENGGRYLGICAGAYYACAALDWAAGTDQEISGPRALAFYSGTASGPAQNLMESGMSGSWIGIATLDYGDGLAADLCYHAGPWFSEPDTPLAHVLARYADLPGNPPAIIRCTVGRGMAILSGPHIERLPPALTGAVYDHGNTHAAYERAVYEKLAAGRNADRVWEMVMAHLDCGKAGNPG